MKDEPPSIIWILLLAGILITSRSMTGLGAQKSLYTASSESRELVSMQDATLKAVGSFDYAGKRESELILVQENSFKGISEHHLPEDEALLALLDIIIERESNGDPKAVNKKFGYKGGMGLTQLIPSTVRYCEERLGRDIDPFNENDNKACALWLLKNEGIVHWEPYSGPYPSIESLTN